MTSKIISGLEEAVAHSAGQNPSASVRQIQVNTVGYADGWIKMPETDADLPWSVKVGRPMLWFIDMEDSLPEARQQVVGRYTDERGGIVRVGHSGFFRKTVKAYRDLPSSPIYEELAGFHRIAESNSAALEEMLSKKNSSCPKL